MKIQDLTRTNSPFDVNHTGMPTFDDMLKDPEYFERAKGRVFDIEWIQPKEYIRLAAIGFKEEESNLRAGRQSDLIDKYANLMKTGTKFPLPVLDYSTEYFSQEGMHRALAAERAGVDKMPVMVVRSIKQSKYPDNMNS